MDDSEVLFDGRTRNEWMDELTIQREWNVRHALALMACLGIPETMLDVGCGDGTWVSVFRGIGCFATGIDQLIPDDAPPYFEKRNLVDFYKKSEASNMVLCLEVAEHLHPSAHPTLCQTLCENLAEGRGNYLVFSSAHPGQGGSIHISERPAQYWHNEFHLRKLNFRLDLTNRLQLAWSNIGSPLWWLPANVMVFEK